MSHRELDREVAEKVLGWTGLHYEEAKSSDRSFSPAGWYGQGPNREVYLGRHYSSRIEDAWKVVEAMRDKKLWDGITIVFNSLGGYTVHTTAWDSVHGGKGFKADTAPHAICLAALSALKADKEAVE